MNEIAQNVYPNKPKLTSFYFVWFAIEILQAIKRIRFFRRSSCSHNSENKILRRLFRSNNRVFMTTAERKKNHDKKKHDFLCCLCPCMLLCLLNAIQTRECIDSYLTREALNQFWLGNYELWCGLPLSCFP